MADSTKEISPPEEHADYDGQTLVTREPDVIRAWAQARTRLGRV